MYSIIGSKYVEHAGTINTCTYIHIHDTCIYIFFIIMRYVGSVCGCPLLCGVGGGDWGLMQLISRR